MAVLRLTFVRHGATDWNRDRRFQGQSDIPLNAQGQAQARALARALRRDVFDYVVSSDLQRAMQTAQVIRGTIPVVADPRWREFAFGEWEGLTWEEIAQRWPEIAEQAATAAKAYAPPGGETFDAVRERVGSALDELRASNHLHALIVTHAGPLHAMLHHLFSDRESEMPELLGIRFTPASITRIAIEDGEPVLLGLNDVTHL